MTAGHYLLTLCVGICVGLLLATSSTYVEGSAFIGVATFSLLLVVYQRYLDNRETPLHPEKDPTP